MHMCVVPIFALVLVGTLDGTLHQLRLCSLDSCFGQQALTSVDAEVSLWQFDGIYILDR